MSRIADEIDREYRLKKKYRREYKRICNINCSECKIQNNCELYDDEKQNSKKIG